MRGSLMAPKASVAVLLDVMAAPTCAHRVVPTLSLPSEPVSYSLLCSAPSATCLSSPAS